MDDMPTFAALPRDMSLLWEVTYSPETFSIKPTFATDKKVWPL